MESHAGQSSKTPYLLIHAMEAGLHVQSIAIRLALIHQ